MRIPLDYYRILGLPIQATADQLQQAHRDRIQQLPRREFSEVAISARKQLIDQAYTVLSDATRRQEYDTSFLAKSYDLMDSGRNDAGELLEALHDEEADPYTPYIDVDESQFIGALLILLELGEYELVLRLGRPYVGSDAFSLEDGRFGEPEIVAADIVLTVALAYLELGREQWQQGQYENAALSLESGQELLLREGVFANIRGEMQSDLFKLRPYRILELVSLPDGQEEARRQGISLLEDMLHDRNGIDGTGDDLSGLGVDDFLRFIQQLRSYLTASEQQVLFEAEARRPSAVATYLAVYALLARGFAQREPALIRRAKMLLLRLGSHQDVHLEQAVCALLLGQTEEASRALELSQEFESLAFIRDHSQGSPDLLPGLCLYSERWFQNEVFPHFRDLHKKQSSLTEYFADEDVQLYLEELPADQTTSSVASPVISTPAASMSRREVNLPAESPASQRQTYATPPSATATIDAPTYSEMPAASATPATTLDGTGDSPPRSKTSREKRPSQAPQEAVRAGTNGTRPTPARRPRVPANLRLDRVLLLAALGLLGLMLLGFLFGRLFNRPQTTTASNDATQMTGIEPVFSEFAREQENTIGTSAPLTEANAPEIVRSWLKAKSAAMGESHDLDQLEQILVDPALTTQKARAEEVKAANSYWKFEHSNIEIISVETSEASPAADNANESPDSTSTTDLTDDLTDAENATDAEQSNTASNTENETASIEANVTEKADFYSDGQLDPNASYDSTVQVRYELVRQDGQWRIRDMQVLN